MKNVTKLLAAISALVVGSTCLHAQSALYWTGAAGDGVWSEETGANWSTTSGGGSPQFWDTPVDPFPDFGDSPHYRAVFDATNPRAITVSDPQNVASLTVTENGFSVSGSTLNFNVETAPSNASNNYISVSSGKTFTISSSLVTNYGGNPFEIKGGGTTIISGGTSTFDQSLRVTNGALVMTGGSITTSGQSPVIGNNASNSASLTVSGGTFTSSGIIRVGQAASGTLTIADTGVVTVGGGAGSVFISDAFIGVEGSGTLNIGNGGAAGTLNAAEVSSGAGFSEPAATINFNHTSSDYTFAPVISGKVNLNHINTGTTILTGANYYDGALVIDAGTVQFATRSAVSTGSDTITVNSGGTLALNVGAGDYFTSAQVVTVPNTTATFNAGSTLALDTTNATAGTFTQANAITGNRGLTKLGSGNLTLSTANTYTGATTISAGTLTLGTSGTIANSTGINLGTTGSAGILNLTAKSDFTFGAAQTVSGVGTLNIGSGKTITVAGAFAPGNSAGIAAVTGNLLLNSTTIMTLELAGAGGTPGTDFDQINVSGTLTTGGTLNITSLGGFVPTAGSSFQLFTATSIGGSFSTVNVTGFGSGLTFNTSALNSTGILTVSAVPEPASFTILASLFALGFATTRRAKRQSA
jgi:autotransporter-associated beta strand protein/T5SS/PEP-CTERM-associated repeat protein